MVYSGIQWYTVVYSGIQWYIVVYSGIHWYIGSVCGILLVKVMVGVYCSVYSDTH